MDFNESYDARQGTMYRTLRINGRSTTTKIADLSELERDAPGWSRWWRSYLRGAVPTIEGKPLRPLKAVDLFCGCGGLTLGVQQAALAAGHDFSVEAAVDVDQDALDVYSLNLNPRKTLCVNVSKLVGFQIVNAGSEADFAYPPELLHSYLKSIVGKVDLVVAGPPCEGHSNLNNRTRRIDPRNRLYLEAVAVAVALRPQAILIENVPDVVNDARGVVATGRGLLERQGYHIASGTLAANDLGIPQTRKRYFLVAARKPPALTEVEGTLAMRNTTDVRWAIEDLLDRHDDPAMDGWVEGAPETKKRIKWLFDKDKYELPNRLRPNCHKDGHTYGSVYGRLHWDEPSGTITTGFLTMGRGRFVHPLRRRTLTPHEAARLQGFPDSFLFRRHPGEETSKKALTKWIGDAVPPILGYATALAVMSCFANEVKGVPAAKDAVTRSRMKAVRQENTKPEAKVRALLKNHQLIFDTNRRGLPGSPDVVFRRERVAVFVNGCYWHQHKGCLRATRPKTNVEFWERKFEQNKTRDKRAIQTLRRDGWHVMTIWECDVKKDAEAEIRFLKTVLAQRLDQFRTARSDTPLSAG